MSIFDGNTYTPNTFFDDSKLYYKNDERYPRLTFGVVNALLAYVINSLYSKEVIASSLDEVMTKRLVRADISAGSDISIGDSIKQLQTMLPHFPVTAFNVDEYTPATELNNYAALAGKYYRDNTNIHAWPIDLSVLFITFFGNPHDYEIARKLLYDGIGNTLTRISVPFYHNGVLITIPADINITIEKATYSHEFEMFLQKGRIYDIAHTCTARIHDLILEDSVLQPVTDINVYLSSYRETYLAPHATESSITFSYPTIISVSPLDTTINIPITSNIVIEFSEPMSIDSIYTNFEIRPYIKGKFTWDDLGKIVTFDPYENLVDNTNYIVTISKYMENGRKIYMENDVSFSFTTELLN